MPNDPRARIFMSLDDFERSIGDLSPAEKRAARVAFVSDGISLYEAETQWTRGLKPHRIVWYIVPLAWPLLWYRSGLSKMTLSAISRAINHCRERWADDLGDSDLTFDLIKDPLDVSAEGR